MDKDKQKWIEESISEYESPLIRYAMGFTRSEDRARDIVQEGFIKLWGQDPEKLGNGLKAWLYRVCRNRCLDLAKKENRMMELTDSTIIKKSVNSSSSPSEESEKRDDIKLILQLIEELPEKQKEVLRLKFQHQMSYREISEVAEITVSNVGVLLHTGLKQLRGKLKTLNV